MNKQKFTPGPWRTGAGDFPTIYDRNHDKVAHCLMRPEDESGDGELTRLANAKLVAAAPDLLAAAQKALAECCDMITTDTGNALAAAIAKATGHNAGGNSTAKA